MISHLLFLNINLYQEARAGNNSLPESVAIFVHFFLIDLEFLTKAKASSFEAVHLDHLSLCYTRGKKFSVKIKCK